MTRALPAVWHPFTQLQAFEPLGEVVRAEGAWLHLSDGRRVLDGIASWWVNLHGHAHPRLVAALTNQAAAFDQVILADFTHAPAAQLSAALAAVLPGDLQHLFFSDDGSTAVEVAIKMAWQAQRLTDPGRHRLVAFDGSYHGDTVGALSVGEKGPYTGHFDGLRLPVDFLPWDDADAAATFFRTHGHEVVAVIVEPMVQCAGGMRMAPPSFLAAVAQAAKAAGALLIADEVAVGFGRTGRLWGCDHADVVPDLLCVSKGLTGGLLPLGITAARPPVYEAFLGADKRSAFLHGHSYTGNPIACAVAVENLVVMRDERTVERLAAMASVYAAWTPPPGVHHVRWLGSLFAFDLVDPDPGYHNPIGRRFQAAALRHGLYVRPLGPVVYLMPPAVVTDDELRWALQILHDVAIEIAPSRTA